MSLQHTDGAVLSRPETDAAGLSWPEADGAIVAVQAGVSSGRTGPDGRPEPLARAVPLPRAMRARRASVGGAGGGAAHAARVESR